MIDVDFSSALHNRTGKFFIGQDLLTDQRDKIENVFYWRCPSSSLPDERTSRSIGRALRLENSIRMEGKSYWLPERESPRPVVHLDPFTVCYSRLGPRDIVVCHDMGPISHPDLYDHDVIKLYAFAFGKIQEFKPRMVFVSEASQKAFVDSFGGDLVTTVIYPPSRDDLLGLAPQAPEQVKAPFFLSVGTVGRRKNQVAAVKAFIASGMAKKGLTYVICGTSEAGFEQVRNLAERFEGIRILDYVSDAQLHWLYSNALAFVLPSLLEGFCMPIVEAIQHGAIPILPSGPVFEEVAGPDAIYIDPKNIVQIGRAFQTVLDMPAAEKNLRLERSKAWIERFSRPQFRKSWDELIAS